MPAPVFVFNGKATAPGGETSYLMGSGEVSISPKLLIAPNGEEASTDDDPFMAPDHPGYELLRQLSTGLVQCEQDALIRFLAAGLEIGSQPNGNDRKDINEAYADLFGIKLPANGRIISDHFLDSILAARADKALTPGEVKRAITCANSVRIRKFVSPAQIQKQKLESASATSQLEVNQVKEHALTIAKLIEHQRRLITQANIALLEAEDEIDLLQTAVAASNDETVEATERINKAINVLLSRSHILSRLEKTHRVNGNINRLIKIVRAQKGTKSAY